MTPTRRPSTKASRRVGAAATAAVLATGAALALSSQPAGAATGWSPTATQALKLVNAKLLQSHVAGSTPLRLTVGLASANRSGIDALIKSQATPGSPNYGKYLTPAQFTAQFGAPHAAANAVSAYLTAQGMKNVTVAPNRLQVTADATAAEATSAFNTSIASYTQAGKTVLANTLPAQVPTALAGEVTGVLGLSTLGFSVSPQVGLPNLNGFYPKEFNTVYDSGNTKPGTGTALAVIAEGNLAPTVKDLRLAESKQGLPQLPVSLQYAGIQSPDTAGADEWDLDTQTSTGVAPNAKKLYLYIATSLTDSDLARAINKFVSQDVAKSGSASLGECDVLPYADGSAVVDDIAFAQAAVQGQSFFASSGDTGSSCAVAPTNGVPGSGPTDTGYPASSTYVTGVGGTTLLTDASDNYTGEVSWYAGGGGISPVENSGFWQTAVVPSAAAGARGVPDVAFDADPNTGALIYVNGAAEQIGGTSLSSPLAMGLWTRLQATSGNKLGFASTRLYNYYSAVQAGVPTTPVPGFHDIVAGSNGAYTALPGYDFTTGLGSWDVKALSAALGGPGTGRI